jgi:hypothetical protein
MEGEGDRGARPAVAVRSPLSALMFSGNISCVVAKVLPSLGQFVDLCESVADLLLESIVPDTSSDSVICIPSVVGYLSLQAAFALSVQAQSIPPYISSEMIMKLWDVIHDLVASNCELDDLIQEAMSKALQTTLKRFALVEIGNVGFIVEDTLALARISSLRLNLKVTWSNAAGNSVTDSRFNTSGCPVVLESEPAISQVCSYPEQGVRHRSYGHLHGPRRRRIGQTESDRFR